MKSFTDLFIKRPVLAMVVSFVILIAGLQAMKTLNVRQYPRSDIAAITVTTVYVGADAELVRGFITTPIERAIAAADGIDYIQSQSTQGVSTITARLKLNYDANKALSDISSRVDAIRNNLPPESQIPVIAIQPADSQIASAYLSFTSNILQPNEVTDYLVRLVQPRLTAIGGVQKADILGGRTFAMRIWMKPDRMAALNISPSQVRDALSKNNFLAAVGNTKGSLLQVNLTANTDLHTADQFKQLVVRQDKNTLVRLGDIADVVLGAEDYDSEVRFSGQRAVFMGIFVLPNANSVDVIKRVRVEMEQIKKELPTGMQAEVAYDATAYINDAIHEVVKTLIDTLLIVMVVIFLFLGSFRSVIIPIVAIPISLIGALFLMQVFGFTLNLLTLLAIVLSVGLVVDDAIVVVENIERHIARRNVTHERGAGRRARIDRPDYRDDHHSGRGLHTDRITRRFDRSALPRVRDDSGRRCLYLRRRGARLVTDDVFVSLAGAPRRDWIQRLGRPDLRSIPRMVRQAFGPHPERSSGRLHRLGRDFSARDPDVYRSTKSRHEGTCPEGRSRSHFRHRYRPG